MNINNYAQNHPELVVKDLAQFEVGGLKVPETLVRLVLKNRGINKWLRNRRLIIQLKEKWKHEITDMQTIADFHGKAMKKARLKGSFDIYREHLIERTKALARMNTLADCRQQVRAICHSTRDVDFPKSGWGEICELPEDLPDRPSKNFFC